ncbi:MAG: 3-isopropylmalate dehydratase [Candidatus Aminicenantes bacterium]|nr:3-isopropylmalate dehydratase [Candidatus Aminicenantes bacterium]
MEKFHICGKVWILTDKNGRLIEDIDTDQIYHNAFLHITELSQMGQYTFGNLEGWKDFAEMAGPGDIVVAGRNFGAGSSRQQAVDCFISLGISLICAPSFGAIYFRNAVNSGFPVLRSGNINTLTADRKLETGDEMQVDILSGEGRNITKNHIFRLEPMSSVQQDIFSAGGLFGYAKKMSSGR